MASGPRLWRRRLLIGCAIVVLYVGSYAVLSFTGGWIVSISGEFRPIEGIAMTDILEWQPRYGYCRRIRNVSGGYRIDADPLGYVYCPLVLLDQRYVHRTMPLSDLNAENVPPYDEYHPLVVNRFHGRFPYVEGE